jgi:hypothetical protein
MSSRRSHRLTESLTERGRRRWETDPVNTARQETTSRRWVLPFLAALVAVLATILSAATASAATQSVAETRVRASAVVVEVPVGPPKHIGAGQRLGEAADRVVTAVATGVAANAGTKLPEALTLGKNAEEGVHVYYGTSGGKNVYAGITNSVERRGIEHGDRFVLNPITTEGLTRGEARAVEQALIVRNPGFENIRNSISPNHAWYQDAVDWGEAWLQRNGY